MNTRLNLPLLCLLPIVLPCSGTEFFVSPDGADTNPGTRTEPFATLGRARDAVRQIKSKSEPVTIYLSGGTYYLPETVLFTPADSGTAQAPVTYAALAGQEVVLSGGMKLALSWQADRNGIFKAQVPPDFQSDQLFLDGQLQPMARFPNFDPAVRHFNGFAADAFSPERAARWTDPRGGFIHAMHRHEWGDFHYLITGKDANNKITFEGGWQNNRRLGMHDKYRMVENIFEELDAPGEWFHSGPGLTPAPTGTSGTASAKARNTEPNTLYFCPPPGADLSRALIEGVRLRHLVEFRGAAENPVRFIRLRGLTFRHAARTFMDNKEPLLRSDWTTYRGGAIFLTGTEDCTVEDCLVDQVGGNAVFVSQYNRRVAIRGCEIGNAGGNGVAFVGDPRAVRNPLFEYGQRQSVTQIDRTPGPKSPDYPADCLVEDCLIYRSGRVEKQTAPVQIAMAQAITVRHCSLYDVPRAGLNIGDGCWGGHLIEFCDIFDTVKETGDHGSFNSWGRDRYWELRDLDLNTVTLGNERELPRLDTVKPIVLRNNRWRCDHGWDIDLDDGSSNYEIRNNLCLNGGIKLREGFYRVCENNIMVNNSFHPHVWYRNSQDVFRRNLVFAAYRPIRVNPPWGKECDFNLWHMPGQIEPPPAARLQKLSGLDAHSVEADAQFLDPAKGDYRVKEDSAALKLGFRNFPMDQFGVRKPGLRAKARVPAFPNLQTADTTEKKAGRDNRVVAWLGAKVKNVVGLGEVSAYGLPGETGVLLVEVPEASSAARVGLRAGDAILQCNDRHIESVADLLNSTTAADRTAKSKLEIIRRQSRQTVEGLLGNPK